MRSKNPLISLFTLISSKIAVKLAVKYAPDRLAMLKAESQESINLAMTEDRERVRASFLPDLSGYSNL